MKMIRTSILTAALCGMVSMSCTSSGLSAKSSDLDSVSYAFGINIGQSLSNVRIKGLNVDAIAQGIRDVLNNNGEKALLTNEESIAIIESYFKKMQEEMLANNLKDGQEFLEKNKSEEGVITTESG
ncbi:MAG: FKBP-type peptidyl-prolyl cis-trans isomerase N-terminal domain-containing protein, partial [Prevotellaceae bacterium]|nr:FKBP-type peptidyl-prolyl cis-trans isomerase N-terminal domain-containing protein [Prevotellaceae bacterium]